MENAEQKKSPGKMVLYLIGYFILGTFYLVINAIPIPLGGIVGAIRIYQYAKKDPTYAWKIRIVILLIAIALGSGLLPLSTPINFSLNFGQHRSGQ